MPNYCDCLVYVYVPHDDKVSIKKFDKIVAVPNKAKLLNTLYPMPKHQPDLNKPNPFYAKGSLGKEQEDMYGRNNTWYDWSINNWGTKWDFMLDDASVDHNYRPGVSKYVFAGTTAWSPCVLALQNSKFDFKIYYAETGMGFWGYADRILGDISYNGDEVDVDDYDTFLDYQKAWKDWLTNTNLPQDLFDRFDVASYFGAWQPEDKPNWFAGTDL